LPPSRIGLAVNLPYLCRSADSVHPNDNTEPVLSLADVLTEDEVMARLWSGYVVVLIARGEDIGTLDA
jgi:hypothetical protein